MQIFIGAQAFVDHAICRDTLVTKQSVLDARSKDVYELRSTLADAKFREGGAIQEESGATAPESCAL